MNLPLISRVVTDFETVRVSPKLCCPQCGAAFSPHALSRNGAAITLRCTRCHSDALMAELPQDDEGDDEC
jgi:hypothetical protein